MWIIFFKYCGPYYSACYTSNSEEPALSAEALDALPTFEKMRDLPSPRVLKSHLPAYLLPPALLDTCKVIIITRTITAFNQLSETFK